jgi:hypothetical protein
MGLFEKDYVLRLIEQLSRMAAAIASLIAGGRSREALASIETARRSLAGPLASSLDRLDGASVVALLGPDKARAYAELAKLESQARAALGEDTVAKKAGAQAEEVERALVR